MQSDSHLHVPAPIIYQPSYETPEHAEQQIEASLVDALIRISNTVYKDSEHAQRAVHAKSHGLLRGTLEVLPDLPEVLAQGVFAQPGSYPLVMRLSTTPGDVLDDKVSTPRGMAIKLVGVPGERLPSSLDATTQDFVLVNGPVFSTSSAKRFLANLKMLAVTTDKVPELKKALSAMLRGAEKMLESAGTQSPALMALGGHPKTHPLGETYYSQVPILYGPYMAKVSVAPVSPELQALEGDPVDLKHKPDGLRDAVCEFFQASDAEWEVRVQLCTDLDKMPVEDAAVEWPEDLSPYIAVARLKLPRQTGWSGPRSYEIDDGMAFSPWHGIAAHRPIGSIMRVRKAAYEMSARFRAERNGRTSKEPSSLDHLPD